MLEKLPKNINDRWSGIVDKWLNMEDEGTQCYPPFEPYVTSWSKRRASRATLSTLNRIAQI